jgi:hypothetical protein
MMTKRAYSVCEMYTVWYPIQAEAEDGTFPDRAGSVIAMRELFVTVKKAS